MCIIVHSSFFPHDHGDSSRALDRYAVGFEVRNAGGSGGTRGIRPGPSEQPCSAVLLEQPAADSAVTDDRNPVIADVLDPFSTCP